MNRRSAFLALAAMALLAGEAALLAQTPAARDLSGTWLIGGRRFIPEDAPMTSWALEIYRRNRAGVTDPREQGLDRLDPLTYCFPLGPARAMLVRQFEIVQSPKAMYILHEFDRGIRRVYLDGRAHPPAWPFGWMGHSTGTWDGDTLVVDTVGVHGYPRMWLDVAGTPHSDQLRMLERFRRLAADQLEVEFRFEDPKAFTRPWGSKKIARPFAEVLEHICNEDNLDIKVITTEGIHN